MSYKGKMTTSQLLAMLNKQVVKEQAKNRELELKVEELEEQFGYECECNKQFVETQNKCERLKTLLYNAITMLKDAYNIDDTLVSIEDTDLLDELGMTQEEYDKIIGGDYND